MDIIEHNRLAWDQQVAWRCRFTVPVDSAAVAAARQGQCRVYLTPCKPIPADWLGTLPGRRVLCLASGGGQQGPLLAAAGAKVTVLDNSPAQLAQDELVAARESLEIRTIQGDMADLSVFADGQFELIVHPVSNTFVPDVRPVWREAFRVLCGGGSLLSGFDNPVLHVFDQDAYAQGRLEVKHKLPYSDVAVFTGPQRQERLRKGHALEFGHTLEDQIGGQIGAGFVITGFYEDTDSPEANDLLSTYMPTYIATRACKA